ncbi:hypothetical protein [Mycobacterium deserti]|uniref:Uncharacterized protein n=1 Tax=Mycobacterium deserti TaxID=2978347 RepID=A0ABT2M782_9MYCO|nr:hypothetical protein [Mycobacterium deserti]MCT7658122.1 hypothetical protein [Mycobacterium deserti]
MFGVDHFRGENGTKFSFDAAQHARARRWIASDSRIEQEVSGNERAPTAFAEFEQLVFGHEPAHERTGGREDVPEFSWSAVGGQLQERAQGVVGKWIACPFEVDDGLPGPRQCRRCRRWRFDGCGRVDLGYHCTGINGSGQGGRDQPFLWWGNGGRFVCQACFMDVCVILRSDRQRVVTPEYQDVAGQILGADGRPNSVFGFRKFENGLVAGGEVDVPLRGQAVDEAAKLCEPSTLAVTGGAGKKSFNYRGCARIVAADDLVVD